MPQARHGLFRFGAFVAARGLRPSINVRISPPNAKWQLSTSMAAGEHRLMMEFCAFGL
jgi:hypothetical protein